MKRTLLALALLFLVACGDPPAPTTHQVRYEVTAEDIGISLGTRGPVSIDADLTYVNATGGIEQRRARTPWTLEFTSSAGATLSVSAQKQTVTGSITCTILVDGTPVQTATADTRFGIASCSGRL